MYNIILVDDERVALDAMEKRIPWQKYGVTNIYKARTMRQAQEIFRQHAIDMMFCDIEMPQGNGLDLFEWVKGFFPYVECVYITCHPEYAYMRQAMKLGCFDYILKPVDAEDIEAIFPQLKERIDVWRQTDGNYQDGRAVPEETEDLDTVMSRQAKQYIDMACTYIDVHLAEQFSVNDMANDLHISAGHLMRMFKKGKNCSIVEYMTGCRIEKAKQLLVTTEKTLQEIAGDVGYVNYSYFAKLFKRMTDMTPNTWRNQHG